MEVEAWLNSKYGIFDESLSDTKEAMDCSEKNVNFESFFSNWFVVSAGENMDYNAFNNSGCHPIVDATEISMGESAEKCMQKCQRDIENCEVFVFYPNYRGIAGDKRCYFFTNLKDYSCGVEREGAISYFPSTSSVKCTDNSDFRDSAGEGCDAYVNDLNACKDGMALFANSYYKEYVNGKGDTALTACCACGGSEELSLGGVMVATEPCEDKNKNLTYAEGAEKWSEIDLVGFCQRTVGTQFDCGQVLVNSIQRGQVSLCKDILGDFEEETILFAMDFNFSETLVNSNFFKWENNLGFSLNDLQMAEIDICDASWIDPNPNHSLTVYKCGGAITPNPS